MENVPVPYDVFKYVDVDVPVAHGSPSPLCNPAQAFFQVAPTPPSPEMGGGVGPTGPPNSPPLGG